jgi:glycosyltransferase involved in cell wall biosynthesis
MHIAIEARALSQGRGGVFEYTRSLLEHVAQRRGGHTISVISDSADSVNRFVPDSLTSFVLPRGADWNFLWWQEFLLPRLLKQLTPDIVHFTKAAVPSSLPFASVVTLYDVIPVLFPESQTFWRRLYWPPMLRRAALASRHIITISEQSKRDVVRLYHVPPDKITVTPLAINQDHFSPASDSEQERVKQHYGITLPYLLFVGAHDPRKNIPLLLRAFASLTSQIPHALVIVGMEGKDTSLIHRTIARFDLTLRVQLITQAAWRDLPAFYTGADVFVWPSIYEGWGLPPQEAMACGTPVIVSNGGALPEVVGDAGVIVPFHGSALADRIRDCDFERDLARNIVELVSDRARCQMLARQGMARARQFSWSQVAAKTLTVYEKIYGL